MLSLVGVGSLGIGTAFAGATMALKSFAFTTRDLGIFGRQLGMNIEQLKEVKALGDKFGVGWDTAQGSLKQFAKSMDDVKHHYGQAWGYLNDHNLGDLLKKMDAAPNMKAAFDVFLEGLKGVSNPVKRREIAEQILGTDQWATVAREMTPRLVADIRKNIPKTSPEEEEAANRFVENWTKMENAVEKFEKRVLGPALPGVTTLMDQLGKPVGTGLATTVGMISTGLSGINKAIKELRDGHPLNAIGELGGAGKKNLESLLDAFGVGGGAPSSQDAKASEAARAAAQAAIRERERRRDELNTRIDEMPAGSVARSRSVEQRDKLSEEIRKLRETLEKSGVQPTAFNGVGGGGVGSLIQNASFGGFGAGGMRGGSFGWGGRGPAGTGMLAGGGRATIEGGAPRGDGMGSRGGARMSEMMGYAMDQLRREGVPEEHLRRAASHLVGQAQMESGLDPNTVHDNGTGYGIYGARDPTPGRGRRTDMLRWLAANGYAKNSAEGQMRYMAREAMSGRYGQTRRILMGRGTGDVDLDTNKITGEFEAPKKINRRSGAVERAYGAGADLTRGMFPSVNSREDWSGASGAVPHPYPGSWNAGAQAPSAGDRMLKGAFGLGGPQSVDAKGSVTIHLGGELEKAPARVETDGMFRDVKINRSGGQLTDI